MAGGTRVDRAMIGRFLGELFAGVAPGAVVELRFRRSRGMGQCFREVRELWRVEAEIAQLALGTDVFVGVVPRRRRRGRREDLADQAGVVWADCDGPESVEALRRFRPAPSMVVASGSGLNRHAYWFLHEPVEIEELECANRRLAFALGADRASTDGARILRPAGSLSFKHRPPTAVRLLLVDGEARFGVEDVVRGLREPSSEPRPRRPAGGPSRRLSGDPLLAIPPPIYVERLTGRRPNREGKVRCPFHHDRSPSLHVFERPERGWFCFGCRRGGSIYDFAALLWRVSPRGADFLGLRRELGREFGLEIAGRADAWPEDAIPGAPSTRASRRSALPLPRFP
jgi:CHC2 zinc finger/RepB DNA-primase from phage plasmid